ncbi:spermidine coumaroyl-CoA acyltransferase-like [Brassica napus]|nr:spermidine coumaroyl-CoA acyltransferase-like [Brassica napus]
MERMIKEDVKFDKVIHRLLFMTDMRNLAVFRSMDFGWKEPVNIRDLMFQENAKNMGMILGALKLDPAMEGGVRVVMTLPRDAMEFAYLVSEEKTIRRTSKYSLVWIKKF